MADFDNDPQFVLTENIYDFLQTFFIVFPVMPWAAEFPVLKIHRIVSCFFRPFGNGFDFGDRGIHQQIGTEIKSPFRKAFRSLKKKNAEKEN